MELAGSSRYAHLVVLVAGVAAEVMWHAVGHVLQHDGSVGLTDFDDVVYFRPVGDVHPRGLWDVGRNLGCFVAAKLLEELQHRLAADVCCEFWKLQKLVQPSAAEAVHCDYQHAIVAEVGLDRLDEFEDLLGSLYALTEDPEAVEGVETELLVEIFFRREAHVEPFAPGFLAHFEGREAVEPAEEGNKAGSLVVFELDLCLLAFLPSHQCW